MAKRLSESEVSWALVKALALLLGIVLAAFQIFKHLGV